MRIVLSSDSSLFQIQSSRSGFYINDTLALNLDTKDKSEFDLKMADRSYVDDELRKVKRSGEELYSDTTDGIWRGIMAAFISIVVLGAFVIFALLFWILPRTNEVSEAVQRLIESDNCTVAMCPPGPIGSGGPPGLTGSPGPQGNVGPEGPDGPVGNIGPIGQQGPPGVCAGNPIDPCPPGATGPTGPAGPEGPQGSIGFIGPIGPTGPPGPVGAQGSTGPIGLTGPQGIQGIDGVPGTCPCSGVAQIFPTIDLTGGSGAPPPYAMTCSGGGFIDPTCFPGGTGCSPSLSTPTCEIQALRLDLFSQIGGSVLQVGTLTDAGLGRVTFGNPNTGGYLINIFNVYASNTFIRSGSSMVIKVDSGDIDLISSSNVQISPNGNYNVLAGGSFSIVGITGSGTISASVAIGISSADMSTTVTGIHSMSSGTHMLSTSKLDYAISGTNRWFLGDTSLGSLTCAGPHPPSSVPFESALRHYKDMIIVGDGTEIIADNSNSFLRMGPFLEICGGIIKGASNFLQLGDDDTDSLSIKGSFSNGGPSTDGKSVSFDDDDGVLILNGPGDTGELHVEECVGGGATQASTSPLETCDGFIVRGGDITLGGATGSIDFGGGVVLTRSGTTITLSGGDFDVSAGSITASGSVTAGGALGGCSDSGGGTCSVVTSDLISKMNISHLEGSLERILGAEVFEFYYKKEYTKDPSLRHRGFIAQYMKSDFPRMVHEMTRTIGNTTIENFHTLDLTKIIPDVVGALQKTHSKVITLHEKISKLENLKEESEKSAKHVFHKLIKAEKKIAILSKKIHDKVSESIMMEKLIKKQHMMMEKMNLRMEKFENSIRTFRNRGRRRFI